MNNINHTHAWSVKNFVSNCCPVFLAFVQKTQRKKELKVFSSQLAAQTSIAISDKSQSSVGIKCCVRCGFPATEMNNHLIQDWIPANLWSHSQAHTHTLVANRCALELHIASMPMHLAFHSDSVFICLRLLLKSCVSSDVHNGSEKKGST